MKKIFFISLFVCLNIVLMAFADEWVEVYNKIYIKIEKRQNDKVFYWSKSLNDGTMKPVDNQKIEYIMDYSIEDCSQNSSTLLATYEYGRSGKALSTYVSPYYSYLTIARFSPVVPQSVGEVIHKYVCDNAQ